MLKTKAQLPTIIAVILTIVLLVVAFSWFRSNIDILVVDSTEKYLTENAKALSAVFYTELEDQLVMLESQARYFTDINFSDYNAIKSTIMSTKGIGAFKTIGVADASGKTINYNGRSSGNVLHDDYYKVAMTGETAVSATTKTDESGAEVLVVAVPIIQNEKTVGVIFGTFDKNILSKLVDTVTFSGRGTNLLLAKDGRVLALTEEGELSDPLMTNFFEYTGLTAPEKGKAAVLQCRMNGSDAIAVITSVGVHDWLFATVIPKAVVDEQTSAISADVFIVMLVVSLSFVILFASILYLIKNYDTIKKSNEKFKLVSVEAQDLIFDYSFPKHLLTLDGNCENLLGENKITYTRDEMMTLLELVNPEDAALKDQIKNIPLSKDTSIRGEMRLKCLDGSYSWFRIKATVIRVHDGQPQQVVGSLINVDEQMNKELRLIEKAETDPLTGIYNKGAFYEHVSEKINAATTEDLYAIYIIDLDNFKAVNDNLGHAMGDQVLMDVAKKLCIVFSDKDCVGRIGGDEFAAFLQLSRGAHSVGMSIIEGKAKAICAQMEETYRLKKKEVTVSSSVGVAIFPTAGMDYDTLYKNADKALYKVKENGKNMYSIYSVLEHGSR